MGDGPLAPSAGIVAWPAVGAAPQTSVSVGFVPQVWLR